VFAGNYAAVSHPHGISCYGCQDSLFMDNTLIALPGATHTTLLRTPTGVNNQFENNQIFDLRSGTIDDVRAVLHEWSDYKPSFIAGSDFDYRSFSDVVPEPGTWLQLIAGFALVGLGLRRRRRAFAPPYTLA